jgi:DNA topoisomerase III
LKVGATKFIWSRTRLFDQTECQRIKDICSEVKLVKVTKVEQAPTYKKRPLPLNTVEAQKLISRQLKISPAKCMDIMEKLYNRGFISYPRTETNIYHKSINLREIVKRLEKEEGDFGFG